MTSSFFRRPLALAGIACSLLNVTSEESLAQNTPPEPAPAHYGDNVFRPGALWLDDQGAPINAHGGGILMRDGTYYWFGEHKVEGEAGNKAQVGVHAYSSTNLYNWKDEGIALAVSQDPTHEIAK